MSIPKPSASPDPAGADAPAPGRSILLSGNEAIARGAREAGVRVATGYPGTPSTEILESLARMDPGRQVYVEWSTNEKVAMDVALGAAMGGARALCAMKHVGLHVAADTFMTAAYTGVRAGLVVVSADDPGIHSSQNEQDNRLFSRFAGVPMLEPADSSPDPPQTPSPKNEQHTPVSPPSAGVPMLEPADSQEARDFTVEAFAL